MNESKGRNNRYVKTMNRYAVLQYIRHNAPVTKADIAAQTKLTYTAINNIVEEIKQAGLIIEEGYDTSSGGRKPVLLHLKADAVYFVGVHVSASTVRAAAIDFRGDPVVLKETILVDAEDKAAILAQIYAAVEYVIAGTGAGRERFAGIGLGVPGPLDPYKGQVMSPPNLQGLSLVPLKDLIEERFGLPAAVEKDANTMALGELWFGAGRGFDSLVFIDADVGIGSGFIFNRSIYQGFPYGAGEIGHGTIDLNGPRCNCGNYGCLEAVASGMAVVRRIGEEIGSGGAFVHADRYSAGGQAPDIRTIIEAARGGDSLAVGIMGESARYMGIALANLINLLTPETIIVGGMLVNRYPAYFEQIRAIALSRCFASFHRDNLLQPSQLKRQAGVIGAGTLALDRYLLQL